MQEKCIFKAKKGQTPSVTDITTKELAVDIKYYEIYQFEKDPSWVREKMVVYAKKHGIKAAARHFCCSKNTVKLWLNDTTGTYKNRSRRPHSINNRTPEHIEKEILDFRENEQMGAENLKHQYNIPVSESTIYRVLKRNNKIRPRKDNKRQRSKDLRKIKAKKQCFEVVQVDGKVLNDIPHFYPYYIRLDLPLWQFTFTCQKSGATFYAYCKGETSIAACTFIVYVIEHLKKYGVNVKRINTDRGSFAVGNNRSLKHTAFQKLLKSYEIKHYPIRHKNQNADVERFHGLVEQYFYQITDFDSKLDFYKKAMDKQIWFNCIRKNRNKEWQTPMEVVRKDFPSLDPQALILPPIDLDKHYSMYRYKTDSTYEPLTFESFFQDVPYEYLQYIQDYSEGGQYVAKVDGENV